MSKILYYSNNDSNCRDVLSFLVKSGLRNEIHFVCIDKRITDPQTGKMYILMENGGKVLFPHTHITGVPAMVLLDPSKYGMVLFGLENIRNWLIPAAHAKTVVATKGNLEPVSAMDQLDSYDDQGFGTSLLETDSGIHGGASYDDIIHHKPIETGNGSATAGNPPPLPKFLQAVQTRDDNALEDEINARMENFKDLRDRQIQGAFPGGRPIAY